MQLFGEVKEGKLDLLATEKLSSLEGERVIVNVFPLTRTSDGQLNLLRLWLRVISQETGVYWRDLYQYICFPEGIKSEPSDLKSEEINAVLKELEWLAADLELVIPFPKTWDRKPRFFR
jgi:hypothetical protein